MGTYSTISCLTNMQHCRHYRLTTTVNIFVYFGSDYSSVCVLYIWATFPCSSLVLLEGCALWSSLVLVQCRDSTKPVKWDVNHNIECYITMICNYYNLNPAFGGGRFTSIRVLTSGVQVAWRLKKYILFYEVWTVDNVGLLPITGDWIIG